MFQLKPLTKAGIPHALEKAERYRLLNEPAQAESICLDIIHTEPTNQPALINLLLSLTDQFREGYVISEARIHEVLARIQGDYEQAYYAGIVFERRAKAKIDQDAPHAKFIAYELCRKAMDRYEAAEKLRHAGNDDALLRWNACARMIMQHKLEELEPERVEPQLE
jgi:hypothetical protein